MVYIITRQSRAEGLRDSSVADFDDNNIMLGWLRNSAATEYYAYCRQFMFVSHVCGASLRGSKGQGANLARARGSEAGSHALYGCCASVVREWIYKKCCVKNG